MSSSSERGWERLLGSHACVAARAAPRPYKPLKIEHGTGTLRYRASLDDCRNCSLKAQYCPNAPLRYLYLSRDFHEDARDVARRKMTAKAFPRLRDERKRVEMRFAHLKTHHGFERLRLRGLFGARDEFHLAAIVQNLKTMAPRLLRPPEPARA